MIVQAIERAYQIKEARNWDTLYWAIDLHGVCLRSTYKSDQHEWINDDAIKGLQAISRQKENKIILWSAVYEREKQTIVDMFGEQGIQIFAFNANPEVDNTAASNFAEKFYFNLLLDDKAGFDPDEHWWQITKYYCAKEILAHIKKS